MRVKICGITQAEQAVAIAQLGATALGFICVPASPRYLSPTAIEQILAALQQTLPAAQARSLDCVGVFANASAAEIAATVAAAPLTAAQLHGDEPPALLRELRQQLPHLQLIKALRIRTATDLDQAALYAPLVDSLLLDAYHPQMLGGTGKALDWPALATFRPACPWLLAGGLTPENIAVALSQLSPDGIDLSSGVETSPGIKDLQRVRQLFEQLRPWLRGEAGAAAAAPEAIASP